MSNEKRFPPNITALTESPISNPRSTPTTLGFGRRFVDWWGSAYARAPHVEPVTLVSDMMVWLIDMVAGGKATKWANEYELPRAFPNWQKSGKLPLDKVSSLVQEVSS